MQKHIEGVTKWFDKALTFAKSVEEKKRKEEEKAESEKPEGEKAAEVRGGKL